MATTYTTNAGLAKPAGGDRNWHTPILAMIGSLDVLAAVGPLAVRAVEIPSTSLNIRVAAGSFRKSDGTVVTYAGTASFGVTASGTRRIYLTDSGTLTDGSAWPGTDHVRLATVVTGTTTITSIVDERIAWSSFGAGGGSYLPSSGGTLSGDLTLADGVNLVAGTTTGTQIGEAANQRIGFHGATAVAQRASADQAALTDSTGGSVSDATLVSCATADSFTVSTGGSASTVLAAITLPSSMGGSPGGTADGSWQSIPDPADTPASADALRDDLVANAIPAIRNNFAETATEIAAIRTAIAELRDNVTSIGGNMNTIVADADDANDNFAKLAELVNELRAALVEKGLIKGSA